MSSRFIPHLIPSILLCLPVKDLLRFRCLSKALCHEIDSLAFTMAHLNRSIQTKTRHKLIFLNEDDDFSAIDFASELSRPTKVGNPSEYKEGYSKRTLYRGSCNGLLLLSSFYEFFVEHGLWLWNPFTRKSTKLPDFPGITGCVDELFGFGYDPLSNDYKVVQISISESAAKTSVFSMKSDTWTKLPHTIPLETYKGMFWDAVFVDGALHWLSHDDETSDNESSLEIVSFDISKEMFVNLIPPIPPIPSVDRIPNTFDMSLEVLEGSLVYCLLDRPSKHVKLFYTVKNGQQQISWTKLYKLELSCLPWSSYFRIFDEYSKDGNKKILLQTISYSDDNFLWYDLEKGTWERIDISQVPMQRLRIPFDDPLGAHMRASFCRETLVSPQCST